MTCTLHPVWRPILKLITLFLSAAFLTSLPALAGAEEISTFTSVLTSASPTEQGRLSRNGVQQTWTGAESYPGIINSAVTYNYMTYTFAASLFTSAPYVEISFFDTLAGVSLFSSAYANAYNPPSFATGWLGDEGASGNYFGSDARYYDVLLPANSNLVLVVNTSASAGLNDPFTIDVSAYADTNYDDPSPAVQVTPEPSTFVTLGTGLIWAAGLARRRRSRSALE